MTFEPLSAICYIFSRISFFIVVQKFSDKDFSRLEANKNTDKRRAYQWMAANLSAAFDKDSIDFISSEE